MGLSVGVEHTVAVILVFTDLRLSTLPAYGPLPSCVEYGCACDTGARRHDI